jgi:hypothetical protein
MLFKFIIYNSYKTQLLLLWVIFLLVFKLFALYFYYFTFVSYSVAKNYCLNYYYYY